MKTQRVRSTSCNKLASTSGETMTETLVSILVSSLALLLMATAIGTAVNMVKSSRETMTRMYEDESSMVASVSASPEPSTTTSGSIEFSIPLELDDAGSPKDVNVTAYSELDGQSAFYEKR